MENLEKKCTKCGVFKPLSAFSVCSKEKDGRKDRCKTCINVEESARREQNKKNNTANGPSEDDKRCSRCKLVKSANNFSVNLHTKSGRNSRCIDCHKVYMKDYQEVHTPILRPYYRKWKKDNKEHVRMYVDENREHIRKFKRVYEKAKKSSDPLYGSTCAIRSLLRTTLKKKGFRKNTKTAQILGCTWEEFKSHIENRFWPGMTWENMGEWHLDHKIPISSGTTEAEVLGLNHYLNFQPLWADDNLIKSDRLDWTPAESSHPSHETDY